MREMVCSRGLNKRSAMECSKPLVVDAMGVRACEYP